MCITYSLVDLLSLVVQKNLPRKKRRKLEAQREMLEDDRADEEEAQVSNHKKAAATVIKICFQWSFLL
jgi:hypothetical protein